MRLNRRRGRTAALVSVLAIAGLTLASCDAGDVDRLPRATIGKRCSPNGSFARTTVDVLQCVSGRWRVSMSIARAKQLIVASQTPPTTAAPRTTVPRTPNEGANIETASASAGTITVSGWAFGGTMGITVDGVPVPTMPWVDTLPGNYPKPASWWLSDLTDRPDVAAVHGSRALRSGFKVSVDTRMLSSSQVCVGVINGAATSPGGPTSIRPISCVTVVVPTPRTSPPNFGRAFIETATPRRRPPPRDGMGSRERSRRPGRPSRDRAQRELRTQGIGVDEHRPARRRCGLPRHRHPPWVRRHPRHHRHGVPVLGVGDERPVVVARLGHEHAARHHRGVADPRVGHPLVQLTAASAAAAGSASQSIPPKVTVTVPAALSVNGVTPTSCWGQATPPPGDDR